MVYQGRACYSEVSGLSLKGLQISLADGGEFPHYKISVSQHGLNPRFLSESEVARLFSSGRESGSGQDLRFPGLLDGF